MLINTSLVDSLGSSLFLDGYLTFPDKNND